MSKPDPLAEMLDNAEKHARQMLVGTTATMMPLFDLRDGHGQSHIVGTPFNKDDDKDAIAEVMRGLMRDKGIVRYLFLSEAWMIQRMGEWRPGEPTPAQADDRVEVVVAIATDGVDYQTRRWKIEREGKKCVALVRDSTDTEVRAGGGRFDTLLDSEVRH